MKSSPWQNLRRDGKYFFDLIFSQRIRTNALQAIPFWLASLLTGLIAVAYTKLFAYSETILQTLLHWHGWMIFLMTPFCFFLAWLVVRVLRGGSGHSHNGTYYVETDGREEGPNQ